MISIKIFSIFIVAHCLMCTRLQAGIGFWIIYTKNTFFKIDHIKKNFK